MTKLSLLPSIGWRDRARRLLWGSVRALLYRPTPAALHGWRCWLLRAFGAAVTAPAYPYPSAVVWAPWNLVMEAGSCLGPGVDCYNVSQVILRRDVTVSQRSYLCTASHDFDDPGFPLTGASIEIEEGAWIAAEAFIGPGVHVGARAVVLARSVVVKDVAPGAVIGGNPARYLRERASL